jgi:hypothetical protein
MKGYRAPGNDRWRLGDPLSVRLIDQSLHETLGELQTRITFVKDNTSLVPPEKISSLTTNILSSTRQLDHMAVKSGLIFPRVACFKKFNDSLDDTLGELQEKVSFLKDNTSLLLPGKISSLTEKVSSLIMQLDHMAVESGLGIPRVAGFMDLPVELRQQIWQFAIQAPQNITVQFKYSVPRNPSYRQLVLLSAYCPISQVNSEARREVLLYLQQQESIGKPTLPAIVANFDIDLLWWIDMDWWEIPEALTPLITSKPLNGRDPSSQRIRRIATPYFPWADILTNRTSDSVGYITFRAMEVLHKLGVEEVILVYTRFEEGTNLENFDVMLVPAQQNKLRVLKKFFHDRCRRVSTEVMKRRSAQLGDVLHDHVVNLQEQALREIERWREQGKGMY